MINAPVPIKIPSIEIPDMILIACIFLVENRYRLAMYIEVFKSYELPVMSDEFLPYKTTLKKDYAASQNL